MAGFAAVGASRVWCRVRAGAKIVSRKNPEAILHEQAAGQGRRHHRRRRRHRSGPARYSRAKARRCCSSIARSSIEAAARGSAGRHWHRRRHCGLAADVTDPEQVGAYMHEAQRFGGVDIALNAGIEGVHSARAVSRDVCTSHGGQRERCVAGVASRDRTDGDAAAVRS
jgi:hypothetical protein